jgi:hypothetical protein
MSDKFTGTQALQWLSDINISEVRKETLKSNSLEVSSQTPDAEDINKDYNLDQTENYNQYEVKLRSGKSYFRTEQYRRCKNCKSQFPEWAVVHGKMVFIQNSGFTICGNGRRSFTICS